MLTIKPTKMSQQKIMISFRLDPRILDRIDEDAKDRGITRTAVITDLLLDRYAKEKPEPNAKSPFE